MKRIVCIFAAPAIVLLLAGCRISRGEEFEPTAMGYDLSRYTSDVLDDICKSTDMLLHFSEWLGAEEDEREALHDLWFYSSRIVERDEGEWHIINSGSELTVITGGATLNDEGASWQFRFGDGTYIDNDFPVLTRLADDGEDGDYGGGDVMRYSLQLPALSHGRNSSAQYGGTLTLTVKPYEKSSGGSSETLLRYTFDGSFSERISRYSFGTDLCEVTILEPLEYYPHERYDKGIACGRTSMTVESEGKTRAPEAEYTGGCRVRIYGGAENAYTKEYDQYRYYYPWE